ncbi:MAG: hypothetical protein JETCAE02_26760 [Anaerolineaceae bacterium]|jgi:hypothetical protein|nr:hypothetical protein [Anaerolineae bacterium]MBL1172326.1 hypothetical protein [Chloroflexota bacterium]MBV6466029.1 hypothetical protein [Anaerolineales bacterium]MDL1926653.1 hypothetical protein [Anaerolineae bacterium AMX1]OQY80668.1 MAG: hypothetical protein B6D40_12540 [Anaerolineae bacterium UTCFX3]GER80830.1 conserved hypothetical protein [Candidatus Denitrolinea symbiosum]GJQ40264.1 MAG: hypothetical protein JETCAE02_26760 [Anaerolineaceae bacterium]
MGTPKILVLTGRSLLVQGIISNLQKTSASLEMETADAGRADLLEWMAERQPDIVILESSLRGQPNGCPFNRFFEILPHLIVLEVNLNNSSVQMIRSDLYETSDFADFLGMIQSVKSSPHGLFAPLSATTHE